jgi:ribosomal protein S27E
MTPAITDQIESVPTAQPREVAAKPPPPTAFTTRRLLQRECPICGHVQMVAPSRIRDVVTCERCDYLIPPRRKAA